MNEQNQTGARQVGQRVTGKPVTYHKALERAFDGWAAACGWDAQSLRQATEQAIRTRHHEALIDQESHKARGKQPDIFTLWLDSVRVYFTVEPDEIVIRGYAYEIDGEPLDDWDGGGFYAEASWDVP